jgi:hypothetical protein
MGAIIIPTSAVKTASAITRGFIGATKSGRRAVRRDREGNGRRETKIAVVFMVTSLKMLLLQRRSARRDVLIFGHLPSGRRRKHALVI